MAKSFSNNNYHIMDVKTSLLAMMAQWGHSFGAGCFKYPITLETKYTTLSIVARKACLKAI